MAPLSLSLLLLLSLSSSPSLLTPAAAICAPLSSPYQALLDNYLPAPVVGDDATNYDDDDSPSPSPMPSLSSPVKSPAPASMSSKPSPTSPSPAPKASAPAASTPKPSATTSPSQAPKASAPAASTLKPSPTTSPSPAPKASAPAAPAPKLSPATSPSPAPKASAPAAPAPKLSPATSPSPAPKASAPTVAPQSATSPSPSGGGDKHGGVSDMAAGSPSIPGGGGSVSGVLDPSLKPICAMVPYPAICEGNVKAAAPKSLKSVDVRSAFTLMMEAYTDEIREIRDKSRALVTSDLYSDPLNMCNRSLGGMLRTSKEMAASFEKDDGGALKSGMDSLVSSLMSCKEKATAIKNDMVRLYNIWDNIEAIFEKLYPALDPRKMFPNYK